MPKYLKTVIGIILAGALAGMPLPAQFAMPTENTVGNQPQPVEQGSLKFDVTAIAPGASFTAAIQLKMAEGWHTYWLNPGEAGLPLRIHWTLPAGITAGKVKWPTPQKIKTPSPIAGEPAQISYGYEHDLTLLIPMHADATLKAETPLHFKARINWLACKEMCVPGTTRVEAEQTVTDQTVPNAAARNFFKTAQSRLPVEKSNWQVRAEKQQGELLFFLRPPKGAATANIQKLLFIPAQADRINDLAEQTLSREKDGFSLRVAGGKKLATAKKIAGLLVADSAIWDPAGKSRALQVQLSFSSPTAARADSAHNGAGADVGKGRWMILLSALLFAFVGGLILNLMPCVLPVLSLKILSLVHQAENKAQKPLVHGLFFGGGVLVSFWILAGLLLALRAGGQVLGWGFQLQEPGFILGLSIFFFVFALSLFGVFEIGTSLTGMAAADRGEGRGGAFFSGCLATIVATPCTAPFMGTALGVAATQPAWGAMLIFTFLGLGMATPYVLLTAFPALLRFVPRPGAWMESFKQFLGFLLMGTVLWLLLVLGRQTTLTATFGVLFGLLFIALGAWILGRWATPLRAGGTRFRARLGALILAGWGIFIAATAIQPQQAGQAWEPYSQERLEQAIAARKPVLIDFMADWCLTCLTNDRVAFTDDVVQQFRDQGVVLLKADWTKRDARISQALAGYGRDGVPLYVLYDQEGKHRILPQLLTPQILLNALATIQPPRDKKANENHE